MSQLSGVGCGAPGIGAICVSSTRRLWPPGPGCLCAVEDGPSGDISLTPSCYAGGGGGGLEGGQSQNAVWLTSAD